MTLTSSAISSWTIIIYHYPYRPRWRCFGAYCCWGEYCTAFPQHIGLIEIFFSRTSNLLGLIAVRDCGVCHTNSFGSRLVSFQIIANKKLVCMEYGFIIKCNNVWDVMTDETLLLQSVWEYVICVYNNQPSGYCVRYNNQHMRTKTMQLAPVENQ